MKIPIHNMFKFEHGYKATLQFLMMNSETIMTQQSVKYGI